MKCSWTVAVVLPFVVPMPFEVLGQTAQPAPVNQYQGMQQREEVFEFTEKPALKKQGEKWVITFASKAACDATVSIEDQDGKVIRHLASGVLGENAPYPLQQGSLAQRIEWDGRGDTGKTAPAGCSVRVALGLRPRFDRSLGWAPNFLRSEVLAVAADAAGRLYVLSEGPGLCVFDREGRYLHTFWPPSARVPAERMTIIDWTSTAWGAPAIYRPRSGGGSTFDLFRFAGMTLPKQCMAVTPDGRLALMTNFIAGLWGVKTGGRRVILLDPRDGAVPEGGVIEADHSSGPGKRGVLGNGRVHLAVSPDGKWLYIGASEPGHNEPASHAVWRLRLPQPEPAELFLGEANASGRDAKHFDQPRGVACDASGNVYVCDYGNDRVQVFTPDGGLFKSIPLHKPHQIAVHPKSGEIYVLTAFKTDAAGRPDEKAQQYQVQLVKLGPVNDPSQRAVMDLPRSRFAIKQVMCLDWSATPPALWVGAAGGEYGVSRGIWRIEDRGERLEKTVAVEAAASRPEGWDGWNPAAKKAYIAADPFREQLYVRLNDCCFPSPAIRVDGRTGEVVERLDLRIEQMCVGPDRLVYMRLEDGGEWLARYDPDARRFVPMTAPEARPVLSGGYGAKKFDFAKRRPVTFRGSPIIGVYMPANYGARTWQDPFGVASNGDIYVAAGLTEEHLVDMEKAGLPRPAKTGGASFCVLGVYSSEGRRKCLSALPGLGTSDGVRVGRGGAVYMVLQCQPAGQKVPDGIAPDGRYHADQWGTLVKFNSAFDKFPIGAIAGRWEAKAPDKITHRYGNCGGSFRTGGGTAVDIENVLWDYGGAAPVTMSGCTCQGSQFDLDRFERIFLPAAQTCSVNVLDANGNLVLRVGGYGNADSRGKDSAVHGPATALTASRRPGGLRDSGRPPGERDIAFALPCFVAVTDEALYVHDPENRRIVRATLGYSCEERVSLP